MKYLKGYFKGFRLAITILALFFIILDIAILVTIHVPVVQNYLNDTLEIETSRIINKEGAAPEEVFKKNYATPEEARTAGLTLNEKISAEGTVMVKNEGKALPLAAGTKLNTFGYVSTHIISGGTGSGGSGIKDTTLLKKSLENAGFSINDSLYDFYASDSHEGYKASAMDKDENGIQFKVGEVNPSSIPAEVKETYGDSKVALYVIGRIGGEGADLPRAFTADSAQAKYDSRDLGKHALELTANELDTLDHLQQNFDTIILVINSSSAMELGFLEDAKYSKVKAALIIGGTGENGINALGKVLKGEVNPSGRLVDTYAYDAFSNPANVNLGNFSYNNTTVNANNGHYVEYEEGIYVGYYYYETRGFTDGEAWYNQTVQYPFGYGLSYTTFTTTVVGNAGGKINSGDQKLSIKVRVTNTGSVAGQEVVQLYYTAPYTNGGIEKAHVKLADYGKTKLLQPGESQEITLTVVADAMSSYDYDDANKNGFKGYELEAGTYKLSIRNNANQVINNQTYDYTLSKGITLLNSETHGDNVVNQFDNISNEMERVLSRADWNGTWPTAPGAGVSVPEWAKVLIEDATKAWVANPTAKVFKFGNKLDIPIKFIAMKDIEFNSPLWDTFVGQLTLDEALTLLGASAYSTQAIPSIGKPKTNSLDGPVGVQQSFMGNVPGLLPVAFASHVTIAQTWDKDLAKAFGDANGEIALHPETKVSGWYAPGVNAHRSQFAGRNFEFFSEDPVLNGKMAAEVIKAAQARGLYVYVKHFAGNDQETHRNGLSTWFDEQAFREVYLLPFSIAVREGKAFAMMSAFNRLGPVWAGSSKTLLTNILRNEWGFQGMVKTDFIMSNNNWTNHQTMLNAGGDVILSMGKISLTDTTSATATNDIKNAVKNILYVTANSNIVNSLSADSQIIILSPFTWWWYSTLFFTAVVLIGASVAGLAYNGISLNKKFKKESEA